MLLDLILLVPSLIATSPLVFAFVALVTYWYYSTHRNLPPGPWGLPIVGCLPFVDPHTPAEEQAHKLSQKYGRVASVRLGSYLIVILDDFESIKEAFVKQGDVFSGRPGGMLLRAKKGDKGLLVTDGESWKEHRRFAISTFRECGMGKFTLQPTILEEIHIFMEELAKQKGEPFEFTTALGMSVANIISTLGFGKRCDSADQKFSHLFHMLEGLIGECESVNSSHLFSWLPYIPFASTIAGCHRFAKHQNQIRMYLRDIIERHKRNLNEHSVNDYIDAFLRKRNITVKKTGNEGFFGVEDLEANLQNLLLAATETSVSILRWAFLLLMIHPDVQKKLHQELDQVLGMDRVPCITDKSEMKYTEAFICEVLRFASVVPLNILHTNLEETHLYGYRIPKGTNITTNFWAVNFDPKLWKNPETFAPERFINDGQVKKPEYFVPFGIGKRSCIGESLAKMELFLYITSILQRFTILPPDGTTPKLDILSKLTRRPKPYKARFVEREGYQVTY